MKENLSISDVLTVFDGSFVPGHSKGQPDGRHSDAFVCFSEGEVEYIFSDRSFTAHEKSLIYLSKGSIYSLNIKRPTRYICVDFNFETSGTVRQSNVFPSVSPDLINEFSRLLRIWGMKAPWYKPRLFSGVYSIYAEAIKSENSGYAKISPIFSQITDFIFENYQNPDFSVADLSYFAKVSPVHLRRIFKSAVNTSPIRYINYLRLEKAKALLLSSGLSISEISEAVGFSDSYYFSRLFKKEIGVSPNFFRKNNSGLSL